MISNVRFGILFRAYNFFSSVLLFNFRFSSRKSQSQQKLAKKITHFRIQFRSKNLTNFMNLDSLEIENNMLPQCRQKTFLTLKIFQLICFCLVSEKSICTAPFLDSQELHSRSTLKANVCIFLYVSVRTFLFQRHSKILSDGGWVGRRLNNFLKVTHCLGLVKCVTIFHFN